MKILHVCLANFYIDNYAYQENMLPKFHKLSGHEVTIIASMESFDKNGNACLLEKSGEYINEYGIPVIRLNYRKPVKVNRLLRLYEDWYHHLARIKPDIIFIHGCQFLDIKVVTKYLSQNRDVKVFVDNHADFSNSAKSFISRNILHKLIWRKCANIINKYALKFYGVLPARVDFLINVYKIPPNKVKLLVMGADDEKVSEARQPGVRKIIREKYSISEDDFLIITGGKIDNYKKQTLLLMQAVNNIDNPKLKLVVFGSIVEDLQKSVYELCNERVKYIGWVNASDVYKYFAASDLVVFPGRHSVFWEQATGLGVPMVVKYWEGTTHVDLGGNCKFLYSDSVSEITDIIKQIVEDSELYEKMKTIASTKGMEVFSYRKISERSISIM